MYSWSWTSGTIVADNSQTVTMRFTPSGDLSYNGTLTITANQTSGTNTIPISGTGDAGAVYADLTGFYDLNAVITDSDPIWGPTDGAREVAVLTIEHSPNSSQFIGTFAEFQFIDPDGKSSAGQKGIVRGSTTRTGQVVSNSCTKEGTVTGTARGCWRRGESLGGLVTRATDLAPLLPRADGRNDTHRATPSPARHASCRSASGMPSPREQVCPPFSRLLVTARVGPGWRQVHFRDRRTSTGVPKKEAPK